MLLPFCRIILALKTQKFAKEGGTINLDGHELLIFQDEEDAQFIEVNSAIDLPATCSNSFSTALLILRDASLCLGPHSQQPEPVQEQMPILIRRVGETSTLPRHGRSGPIVLTMTAKAEGRRFLTHATTILWDKIDPRDGKDVAQELLFVAQALNTALLGGFISLDAAADFLAQYIETMNEYISDDPEIPGERERILKTRLLLARLEDGEGLEEQLKNIIDELRVA